MPLAVSYATHRTKLGVVVEMSSKYCTPSSLDQYESGMRATIVRIYEGRSIIFEADYVVGADGAKA
ncbi:hypothetical protein FA95DRAFT_1368932 [Auriscalpium vulgare]|uniref:Uncharacterized protein n=1 Tax=Auriscalpium vulgare TaxID=40419 RepID=A0ACB8RR64_9AGAM|nr:hypothetical protein FA95DRAFT_1368932 [Auriscalpium vulgare]